MSYDPDKHHRLNVEISAAPAIIALMTDFYWRRRGEAGAPGMPLQIIYW